ncbi:MAG: tetratricopeptide repeat protein, partial [Alphaproteobacteria bacterium]|nr:tetratricopeptide repeat protein [Alphaproteobacteria bacterium]
MKARTIALVLAEASSLTAGAWAADRAAQDVVQCSQGPARARIAACTRLIHGRLNPQNLGAVYFDRAIAERGIDANAAISDYGQAIALRPDFAGAYAARGTLLLEQGDARKAADDFSSAIRLRPKDADVLLNRGAAREALQDREGAIADYSAVIAINPGNERALLDRGIARGESRDFSGALSDFSAVLALSPDSGDGLSGKCWIRAVAGDSPELGMEDCDRAV